MAINDHLYRVPRLRAKVVTVDPSQRIIEVITSARDVRRLALFDIPNDFRWPLENEEWSIYEENGYWFLGNRYQSVEDEFRVEDLEPGDSLVARKRSKTIGDGVATVFDLRHGLGTLDVGVFIREATGAGPYDFVFEDIVRIVDENTIRLTFLVAPDENEFRVTVIG